MRRELTVEARQMTANMPNLLLGIVTQIKQVWNSRVDCHLGEIADRRVDSCQPTACPLRARVVG